MVNRITIWLSCSCAGAISAVFWQKLPSLHSIAVMIAMLVIVAVVSLLFTHNKPQRQTTLEPLVCAAVSGLLVGVLWVASVGHFYYAWQLPDGKIQQDVTISGRVLSGGCVDAKDSEPLVTRHYIVAISTINQDPASAFLNGFPSAISMLFDFKARITHTQYAKRNHNGKSDEINSKLSKLQPHNHKHHSSVGHMSIHHMSKRKGFGLASYSQKTECLHNGDEFSAVVKLKPAYGLSNPIGFNRQQHLVSQFIHATGYIKTMAEARTVHHHSQRYALAKTLKSLGLVHESWWIALLLGDKSGFSNENWTLLQRTGTGHLFSISGMHLSIIAGVCLLLLNPFVFIFAKTVGFCLSKRVMSSPTLTPISCIFRFIAPVRLWVLFIVVSFCAVYTLLSGTALPVVRAFVLLCVGCLLSITQRAWRPLNIGLAMLAISLLLFPLSMLSASFYLSVAAVFFIWFLVSVLRLQRSPWYVVLFKLQVALSVIMMPLTLIWFGSVSFIAIAANLIALPVITLILPVCLFSLLSIHFLELTVVNTISTLIIQKCDYLFGVLLFLLAKLSDLSWSAFNLTVDSSVAICALGAFVIALLPKWRFKTVCSLLLFVPLLSVAIGWRPQHDKSWALHVMDAGQASAIMVVKGQRAVIIDSGAQYNGVAQTASQHMLPLLNKLNILSIDHVIHTHSDNDHAGGAETIKAHAKALAANFYLPTDGCERDKAIKWQGLNIHFLWPLEGNTLDSNATSCVVKIYDTAGSVLIPGDIEKTSEYALITRERVQGAFSLQSDILIAPHHGSNTSSTDIFIKQVNPKAVIFTQGYENRWKFPAKSVVKRYSDNKVSQYLTSFHGYTRVTFDEINFKIETQRHSLKKRWYLRAREPRHLH